MIQTLRIDGWHPAAHNSHSHGQHYMVRARIKEGDRDLVIAEAGRQKLIPATGRRRVDLLIVLKKGQIAPDPDAFWKSALDALVKAKLLTKDTRKGVVQGSVDYKRSGTAEKWTEITLTDVEPAPPIEVLNKVGRKRKAVGK